MIKVNTDVPLLTVAIISTQSLVWLGLQKILECSHNFRVVGQPLQRIATEMLKTEYRPDVIILDMETERDIRESIQRIRESIPTSKIVALGGFEDKDRMREAVECGVDGVILKVQPPGVVLAVIESLYPFSNNHERVQVDGGAPLDLGTPAQRQCVTSAQASGWPDALTEREREVIRLVGQGLSNKDIAYHLSIADSTVRHHLTSIFDKVGVPNRQKLILHTHHFRFPPV